MTHDTKLTLASAMAKTSTEEAPAPEIEANGGQATQTGTHAPSSLISDLNAPVDPKDPRSPLSGEELETLRYQMRGSTLERHRLIATVDAVAARERARIRAIVMRLMGNEWSANRLIEEIDRG